jgi:peptidoglycan/LPS O-acetylase OafA/YrhL
VTTQHRIRKEIQFLRAVAVTLVVLSHLGIGMFSGGFVGVDMFFVVSGFVIGLTMVNEQTSTGKISYRRFLERRFFRIYPPLVFMVLVTSVYAYFVIPFTTTQDYFIRQARAAIFSYGNLYYMFQKLNYFVQSGDVTFFLHTWSLGVEEQFYLALPLVIAVIGFFGLIFSKGNQIRNWIIGFSIIAVPSFLLMLGMSNGKIHIFSAGFQQEFVFYSPFTRAWEFAAGLLVAIAVLKIERNNLDVHKNHYTYLSLFSIAVILYVLVTRMDGSGSQINASALTALATSLFIFSLVGSKLNGANFFNLKLFQLIGNSSYSIYLWHWIGVSISLDLMRPNSSVDKAILVSCSLLFAYFSYRFIEMPFRKFRSKTLTWKLSTAIVLLVVPSLVLFGLDFSKLRAREDYGNVYASTVLHGCDFMFDVCTVGSGEAKRRILLYGDSHTYQLIPIFVDYAKKNKVEIVTCALACAPSNYSKIMDQTFSPGKFDLIINSYKTNSGELSREARQDLAIYFSRFAQARESKHLVVLDNPFYEGSKAPRRIRLPKLTPLPRPPQDFVANPITQDWKMDLGESAYFYDPFNVLCTASQCSVSRGGKALYIDNNHLSMSGVRLLEPSLIEMVNQILGN